MRLPLRLLSPLPRRDYKGCGTSVCVCVCVCVCVLLDWVLAACESQLPPCQFVSIESCSDTKAFLEVRARPGRFGQKKSGQCAAASLKNGVFLAPVGVSKKLKKKAASDRNDFPLASLEIPTTRWSEIRFEKHL